MKFVCVALACSFLMSCSNSSKKPISPLELEYPADLNMVSRADWGWLPPAEITAEHEIGYITIHHGGVDYPPENDPLEHIVNLQSWSRSEKKWPDIPYHFMIDLQGNMYETRPINMPGDTNTDYDPKGHALICVMGNYQNQILSEAQLDALVRLAAFLARRFEVPVERIKGHKDYTDATVCPGEDIYRYLEDGTIRARVAKLIRE